MSLPLINIISRCKELILLSDLDQIRNYISETMALIAAAEATSIVSYDSTFETILELASFPQKETLLHANVETAEKNDDPLIWLMQQKNMETSYNSSVILMKELQHRFFPGHKDQDFVIIPARKTIENKPDLIFLILLNRDKNSDRNLEIANSFADFCAALNRLKAGETQFSFRNHHLEKALQDLSIEVTRQVDLNEKMLSQTISGVSKNIRHVRREILKLAPTNLSVLVQGDTGTGKELVAKALHDYSSFRNGPFIAVNVASLNQNLIESELFGHVKGAFTGADHDKDGYFRRTEGGTLFLDEIGDLPLMLQAKLLRVLQEKKFTPVGSTKEIPFKNRIISATHKNLAEMIENSEFRKDLYYRLAESKIFIEPLNKRLADIAVLTNAFVHEYNNSFGTKFEFPEDCLQLLQSQNYDGNVRQLRSIIFNLCRASEPQQIINAQIIEELFANNSYEQASDNPMAIALKEGFQPARNSFEKKLLIGAIAMQNGSRIKAARLLKLPIRTFYNKLKKYGLEEADNEKLA